MHEGPYALIVIPTHQMGFCRYAKLSDAFWYSLFRLPASFKPYEDMSASYSSGIFTIVNQCHCRHSKGSDNQESKREPG